MQFWKLKWKHKKWFLINQAIVIILLIVAAIIAWVITKVELPSNVSKLRASAGWIVSFFVLVLALLNRIGALFKVRSAGFLVLFIMFLGLGSIIDVVTWTLGLMLIPLLLDDIIMRPIWLNIWYNEYDGVVKIYEQEDN